MFIHLGDLSSNTQPGYSPQTLDAAPSYAYGSILASLSLSTSPIILSPFSNICDFNFDAGNAHVDNVFNLVDSLQLPVYWHVALIPSGERLSLATAIADAQQQMSDIYTIMQAYNILHLLRGFCLDNVSQAYKYVDGSQWDRTSFNQLVDYVHTTFNVGVAAIINPSLDALSIFTPPGARNTTTLFTQNPSSLNSSPAWSDWLIHVNPVFTSPLCERGAFSPDMSRVAGMLQLMKTMPNVNHCVVQGFSFQTTPVFDNVGGIEFTQLQLRTLRRTAYFLECLGVTNYSFCADQSYGAYSDVVLHPGMYRPLSAMTAISNVDKNPSGIANVYLVSDINSISIMRRVPGGTDQSIESFDKQLLATENPQAYNTPIYDYPFRDAFGNDILLATSYGDGPQVTGTFGIHIPLVLCSEITGIFPGDPVYQIANDPIAGAFNEVQLSMNLEDHLHDTLNVVPPSSSVGPACSTYCNTFGNINLGDIALQQVNDAFGSEVYAAPATDFIYQYPPLSMPTDVLDDPSSW